MEDWKEFEIKCTDYLNKMFKSYATFKHQGEEDSTIPDILVNCNGVEFYIEAKQSPAQCGQFVLIPNLLTKSFDFSSGNVSVLNAYSQRIIDYMNNSFDEYKEAGTAGKDIIMADSQDVFSKWIIDYYTKKGVRFFITNNFKIFPINEFKDYFYITAKYRVKRSGSSSVGKSRIPVIKDYIIKNIKIQDTCIDADKLFVISEESYHDMRFILDGTEYMFSKRDDKYEIRKLSNTFNANVIFSIKLIGNKNGLSPEEFISLLPKNH